MNTTNFKDLKLTLRSQLIGMATIDPKYWICVEAFNYAEKVHDGERKGGGPEFYHMLSILAALMDKHDSLIDPHLVYAAALLHDTYEDYPEKENELREKFPTIFQYIVRLSKIRNGIKIPYKQYFSEMAACHVCSVVKPEDRVHNLSSMVEVFSLEKQQSYISEVDEYFLSMLKQARTNFPRQFKAYHALKNELNLLSIAITQTYKVAPFRLANPTKKGIK